MKKTILSAAITATMAIVSTGAMADQIYIDKATGSVIVKNDNGSEKVGQIGGSGNGEIYFKDENGKYTELTDIGNGKYTYNGHEFTVDTVNGDYYSVKHQKVTANQPVEPDEDLDFGVKPPIDGGQPLPDTDPDYGINPPIDGGKPLPDNNQPSIPQTELDKVYQTGVEAYNDLNYKVDTLQQDFINFANETLRKFDEMDARIDGTNASLHAVTNARPMVSNGQTAFGVGTGFAGDASAVAVGVAHSFEDSGWSASATINATTGSHSEFNGGAGLQYAF